MYETRAADWAERRPPRRAEAAIAFSRAAVPGLPIVDLGCGPGSYFGQLRRPLVGLDGAAGMLDIARRTGTDALLVQADLAALPFRRGSLGGGWARASFLHVPRDTLPIALAHLHAALAPDAPIELTLLKGAGEGPLPGDDFPGRHFVLWNGEDLDLVVTGAGFQIDQSTEQDEWLVVRAHRARTLPDFVGPAMRVLVCGLNPSVVSADAGFGFARGNNRFWPAAIASGLVGPSARHRPFQALAGFGVGMTDLVKRATPGASELSRAEYRTGVDRVAHLVSWLSPGVTLFVGLDGWRAAVDRTAKPGLQADRFGGAPAYVMPSTSGRNARTTLAELTGHMEAALRLAGA